MGLEIDPVSSVDIYPLLAAILGLDPAPAIDGDPERLVPLLSRNP